MSFLRHVPLVAMLLSSTSADPTMIADARLISWAVPNESAVRALFPNKEAAETFACDVLGQDVLQPTIGQFRLIDVDGDGSLEFLATLDYSGRAFYTTLIAVYQTSRGFGFAKIETNGSSIASLDEAIGDLDGDGTLELLVPELLEAYQGARPTAKVTHVVKLANKLLIKQDAQYAVYYQSIVIPSLQRQIAEITANPRVEQSEREASLRVLRLELEAIRKIIGQSQ